MFFFSNFKRDVTFLPRCWDQSQDPTSGKWAVFHWILPWSYIIPNEILSELIVAGTASLCWRKRRFRNSSRASSMLGSGAQLSSIPLWWSQWEIVLTLPGSRAHYVFWLLGRQGVLQFGCGGDRIRVTWPQWRCFEVWGVKHRWQEIFLSPHHRKHSSFWPNPWCLFFPSLRVFKQPPLSPPPFYRLWL